MMGDSLFKEVLRIIDRREMIVNVKLRSLLNKNDCCFCSSFIEIEDK